MNSKIKQVYTIWFRDLEELIKSELGLEIDIQGRELPNDSYLDSEVTGALYLSFDQWKAEKTEEYEPLGRWDLDYLMNVLSARNVIPNGDYIIRISW
jgi:hypothetical protein